MAKLTRKLLREFASTAGVGEIDVFGSLAAGSLQTSTDPDDIQSLSNWLDGWAAEVMDNDSPVLEDRNAVDFVFSYMLKSIFQMGIPEYLATETYYIGSWVNSSGVAYVSQANSNVGNALTDTSKWKRGPVAPTTSTVSGTGTQTLTAADNNKVFIVTYVSGTAFQLPTPIADFSFIVKAANGDNISGNPITLVRAAAEQIEGVAATKSFSTPWGSWRIWCDGTNWFIL